MISGKTNKMRKITREFLIENFNITPEVIDAINKAEDEVKDIFGSLDDIMAYNQYKVLRAFQENRVNHTHFSWNTGYGYNDAGRETIEKVYARVFNTDAAIVRPIIVNGTHALTLTLTGILRPGEELIYCTGKPYDTLEEVIGIKGEGRGSLADFGISYSQIELTEEGRIDFDRLKKAITPKTKIAAIQRSTGYGWRRALAISEIEEWAAFIKSVNPDIICMADNCYGEFMDVKEPTEAGVDVLAGSLIKNPGGGIAVGGGYIAGRDDLIEKISYRMTSPGIGGECGLMFGQSRTMFQGLFMAPKIVNGAVKGAILCGKVFENLGFEVCPKPGEPRSDIIEAVKLGSAEAVIAFCEGIQAAAPIDSYVKPVPGEMPGYESQVIMAAGAFVQGSSIELSADAPVRAPYIVYFQGGLSYEHSKFGVLKALQALCDKKLVRI